MAAVELLRDVNHDVWHAFRRAYGDLDTAAFIALCTPDLIRAGGPTRNAITFEEYATQTGEWFAVLTERATESPSTFDSSSGS